MAFVQEVERPAAEAGGLKRQQFPYASEDGFRHTMVAHGAELDCADHPIDRTMGFDSPCHDLIGRWAEAVRTESPSVLPYPLRPIADEAIRSRLLVGLARLEAGEDLDGVSFGRRGLAATTELDAAMLRAATWARRLGGIERARSVLMRGDVPHLEAAVLSEPVLPWERSAVSRLSAGESLASFARAAGFDFEVSLGRTFYEDNWDPEIAEHVADPDAYIVRRRHPETGQPYKLGNVGKDYKPFQATDLLDMGLQLAASLDDNGRMVRNVRAAVEDLGAFMCVSIDLQAESLVAGRYEVGTQVVLTARHDGGGSVKIRANPYVTNVTTDRRVPLGQTALHGERVLAARHTKSVEERAKGLADSVHEMIALVDAFYVDAGRLAHTECTRPAVEEMVSTVWAGIKNETRKERQEQVELRLAELAGSGHANLFDLYIATAMVATATQRGTHRTLRGELEGTVARRRTAAFAKARDLRVHPASPLRPLPGPEHDFEMANTYDPVAETLFGPSL